MSAAPATSPRFSMMSASMRVSLARSPSAYIFPSQIPLSAVSSNTRLSSSGGPVVPSAASTHSTPLRMSPWMAILLCDRRFASMVSTEHSRAQSPVLCTAPTVARHTARTDGKSSFMRHFFSAATSVSSTAGSSSAAPADCAASAAAIWADAHSERSFFSYALMVGLGASGRVSGSARERVCVCLEPRLLAEPAPRLLLECGGRPMDTRWPGLVRLQSRFPGREEV